MAFLKGSYYEDTPLFADDAEGRTRFKGVQARKLDAPVPVLEHTVALKERLDTLAHHYYAQARDWRRIADSNPDAIFPEDLLYDHEPVETNGRERLGSVVLIPRRRDVV